MGGLPAGAGALVGQRLGKYELLALLALGGTAEIYLARIDGMAGFEKYVVVKCLHDHLAEDEEFVSMFLDEARLGAQLDHSNIVQTLALGEHEDRYYLVMEFIAGLSLALVGRRAHDRVRGGKIPVPLVLAIAAQAAAGLHYAHEKAQGLVHRDISPQNLVITYEGIVKVVDFGIAKAEYRETRTRSGTVKGKFAYMSPEQCLAGDVDRRTDVFALGVICWELLTGRRLFKRDSTYDTYQAVVACQVPPPSAVFHELDPALDAIVMKALAKDRAQRYPTAEAFGEAMIGYLHHRGKPSGPGEIARFFEECFQQELEDHQARMRELIEGRQRSVADQKNLQWDSSELDGSASMLAPEDLEELSESEPAARPLVARALGAAGAVGPVSPPLASRAMTAPARKAAPSTPPPLPAPAERPSSESIVTDVDEVSAEDDFEAGQSTDVEARTWREGADGDAARLDPDAAPTRLDTGPALPRREPEPPPRRSVTTPAGLRAGGAPLDPLPHERASTLQGAPSPAAARFADAPTQLVAPAAPSAPSSRFADAATVHAAGTPNGFVAPHAASTVVAPTEPQTGQTQMLDPAELIDVAPAIEPPPTGAAPAPAPPASSLPTLAQYVSLPSAPELRRLPPWALAVMFIVVLAAATGLTVAIARALS